MLIIGQESTSVELLLRKASVTSPPPTFILGSPPGLPRQFRGQYTGDLPASVEPMSTYSPSLYCSLPESVRAGIGIRFGIDRNSNVSIIDLMPGSPAEECRQIRPGDRLLSVDGMAVMGMQAPQIEHIVSGPQGSQVILHVEGMQDSARRTVALTRRVHTSSPQLLFPNVASISPMPPLQVSVIPPTPNRHDPPAFFPHSSLASASPGAQQKAAEQRPDPPSPHQLVPFQVREPRPVCCMCI